MTEERADCIKTMFAQACAVVFIAALVSFAIYVSTSSDKLGATHAMETE